MILVRHPHGTTLPAPWQMGWEVGSTLMFPSLPRWGIARAPEGTPLPDGTEPYRAPEATAEQRESAWMDLRAFLQSPEADPFHVALGRSVLDHPDALDWRVNAWLGRAHPLAAHAPITIQDPDAARTLLGQAREIWDSRCSTGVIRTAPKGYQVWIGVGGRIEEAGFAPDLPSAEDRVVAAVRARRRTALEEIRSLLEGWSPHTPLFSSTLADAQDALDIDIRRGPMTADELGRSWDLPVVLKVSAGGVKRWDERVTWDDEASRERHRMKCEAGERARRDEARTAASLLRRHPALRDLVQDDRLAAHKEVVLKNGERVSLAGPVRMGKDGTTPLALVHNGPRRTWMALGHFAARA